MVISDQAKKTAVVVIPGMGEQRPMETLWGFVDAAWTYDHNVIIAKRAHTFAKPDSITGAFELRRITTRQGQRSVGRVDFFEFYWAHLMRGNTLAVVRAGRPFVQRSWFERQFARAADGKLHFHESPRRPVRAASDAGREALERLAVLAPGALHGETPERPKLASAQRLEKEPNIGGKDGGRGKD
jgi:hypothetical protein